MTKSIKHTLALISVSFLTACGVPIPECGETKSVELVKEIFAEQVFGQSTNNERIAQIVVDAVETISKDEKLKKNQCQAEISWKLSNRSIAIIDAIDNPSIEKSQAILVGVLLTDKKLKPFFDDRNPTQQELEEKFYQLSLDKSRYETFDLLMLMTLKALDGDIEAKINNGRIEVIDGSTLKFNQQIKYSIRVNEDKEKKNKYIVGLNFPKASFEAIGAIEKLVDVEDIGKAVINKLYKRQEITQPSVTAPQTTPSHKTSSQGY